MYSTSFTPVSECKFSNMTVTQQLLYLYKWVEEIDNGGGSGDTAQIRKDLDALTIKVNTQGASIQSIETEISGIKSRLAAVEEKATSALAKAEDACGIASQASTSAAAANRNANEAAATATNANATANQANETANGINAKAESAVQTANTAKSAVDTLNTDYQANKTAVEERLTAVETEASAAAADADAANQLAGKKQDKLIAGSNISLEPVGDGTTRISSTGGGGGGSGITYTKYTGEVQPDLFVNRKRTVPELYICSDMKASYIKVTGTGTELGLKTGMSESESNMVNASVTADPEMYGQTVPEVIANRLLVINDTKGYIAAVVESERFNISKDQSDGTFEFNLGNSDEMSDTYTIWVDGFGGKKPESGGGGNYSAGMGIVFTPGSGSTTISADTGAVEAYSQKLVTGGAVQYYAQPKLTAGAGISIVGSTPESCVISATGGGGGGTVETGFGLGTDHGIIYVDAAVIQKKLVAGNGISIVDGGGTPTISATGGETVNAGFGLTKEVDTISVDVTQIQRKLTAGEGIDIVFDGNNTTISSSVGSRLFEKVEPTPHLYLYINGVDKELDNPGHAQSEFLYSKELIMPVLKITGPAEQLALTAGKNKIKIKFENDNSYFYEFNRLVISCNNVPRKVFYKPTVIDDYDKSFEFEVEFQAFGFVEFRFDNLGYGL